MNPAPDCVLLNGRLVRSERARVSVFDRGLLYSDGLFETMRAYKGVLFALSDHLHRLRQSADVLRLPIPDYDWDDRIGSLLERNGLSERDAWVRLTITRGPAPPSVKPPDEPPRPTTIVMARAVDSAIPQMQRRGVTVTLLPYSRHGFIAEHKSLNYLPTVLGKTLAAGHGADEGIFVHGDGNLAEGTTSSLFIVTGGTLSTPPLPGILPGITREQVLRLADDAGIAADEVDVRADDLLAADEAFLTSSVAEILPVVSADATPIGSGRPGPLTRKLQRLYRARVRGYIRQRRTGRPTTPS